METRINPPSPNLSRRRLLQAAASGLCLSLSGPVTFAANPTPRQPQGPFYPDRLPHDRDNDLVQVVGRNAVAVGEITDLQGRVLDSNGDPVVDARVEIWQCDSNGRYIHRLDDQRAPRDPNFQGYGHYTTAADGRYRFRTIKPVAYPGSAPHIHVAVRVPGNRPLITQLYVRGPPENRRDWLLCSTALPTMPRASA